MEPIWAQWWAWVVAGVALAVLEVIVPGYIFLGFALAAVVTGVLIGIGLFGASALPLVLLIFAILALAAWYGLRHSLGRHQSKTKIWERDINDNR